MSNIANIGNKCVGCTSCEHVCPKNAIKMISNSEGFLYPNIYNEKCIDCGLCIKKCPTQNHKLHNPIKAIGLKNKDTDRIMQSASGGASDVIAQHIVSMGGVVFGAAYDESLKVKHILVDNENDLYKIQSSKYVQSDLNNCYKMSRVELEKGRKVLFTGTPCQIAGLYSYLGKEYDNLYTIDLICHGVPSPLFLEKYFMYMSNKLGEPVQSYNFRSKKKRGWGTNYTLNTKSKEQNGILMLTQYGKSFMDGNCYRESCYQCNYANIKRCSDITIGDFWGIMKVNPDFYSDKGVSSVLLNTQKGKELIEQISSKIDICECTIDDVVIKQGNLIKPTERSSERNNFYDEIDSKDFITNIKVKYSFKQRVKLLIPQKLIIAFKKYL